MINLIDEATVMTKDSLDMTGISTSVRASAMVLSSPRLRVRMAISRFRNPRASAL